MTRKQAEARVVTKSERLARERVVRAAMKWWEWMADERGMPYHYNTPPASKLVKAIAALARKEKKCGWRPATPYPSRTRRLP